MPVVTVALILTTVLLTTAQPTDDPGALSAGTGVDLPTTLPDHGLVGSRALYDLTGTKLADIPGLSPDNWFWNEKSAGPLELVRGPFEGYDRPDVKPGSFSRPARAA